MSASWLIAAPLGVPVVPEVNRMSTGDDASTRVSKESGGPVPLLPH
jgi:hypothetical protein